MQNDFDQFIQLREKSNEEFRSRNLYMIFLCQSWRILLTLFGKVTGKNTFLHWRNQYLCYFGFGRISYCRQTISHYKEFLNLKPLYSTVFEAVTNVDFVVHHKYRKSGAVLICQALEKSYSELAKNPRGVVCITQKSNLWQSLN